MADQALGTKHLELLQAAVTRLAGNSFMIKGWSLTLATAVAGFAVKDGENAVALVGIVPVALLWWMDAYYLSLEQAFRSLFKEAKDKSPVRWLAWFASLVLNETACLMWKARKSFQPVLSSNRLIAFATAFSHTISHTIRRVGANSDNH